MTTTMRRVAAFAVPLLALVVAGVLLLQQMPPSPMTEKYVAHGGGTVRGQPCTSSLEALNEGYQHRFRFLELDFNWTTDNELALLHDWERAGWLYNGTNKVYALADFLKLKMKGGLTQLSLDRLAAWLAAHPDAYIVTDIKERNVDALRLIAQRHPAVQRQIIPQIYQFQEYDAVRALGYRHIIFTLYMCGAPDDAIVDFCRTHALLAVTMDLPRALQTTLPERLHALDLFLYVHTINTPAEVRALEARHINGFYTDALKPD